MLIIIKKLLDADFDIKSLNKYSQILLIGDGVYNLNYLDFNLLKCKINILENDLKIRGLNISSKINYNFSLINYNNLVSLIEKYNYLI